VAIEDAYPAEMPDDPTNKIPVLDPDTAERLLSGRLDPADAPPGYDEVAALLQAAAAPAHPHELAGEPAALTMFRASRPAPGAAHPARPGTHTARPGTHRARPQTRMARPRMGVARPGTGVARPRTRRVRPGTGVARSGTRRVRARLVALALAGTLVTGGAVAAGGLWMGADVQPSGRLRSPTGGPGDGGSGSGVPAGVGPGVSWELGSLTPARNGAGAGSWGPAGPSVADRATARHHGGAASRGGGSSHGTRPVQPGKPPKPKLAKPKPAKPKPPKPKLDRPGRPEPARGEGLGAGGAGG
jgi:hypothetical protein